MPGCCTPRGYQEMFDATEARRNARRYRKKGLDPTARRMVEFLSSHGVEGNSILEVGGGIGAVQLELLRAGAARAENIELSPSYEEVAQELLREAGLVDRVTRRIMDFAESPEAASPADIVVMHRVVCCYPHMERLVTAAAEHARRRLAMSFPQDAWWVRLGIAAGNLLLRLRRSEFRVYVHPPAAILDTAAGLGFRPVLQHRGFVWQLAVLEK